MPEESDQPSADPCTRCGKVHDETSECETKVLAGMHTSSLCSACGQKHRGGPEVCQGEEPEDTPLLPGRRPRSSRARTGDGPKRHTGEESPAPPEAPAGETRIPRLQEALEEERSPVADGSTHTVFTDQLPFSPDDMIGHTLADKYALLSILGKGGMSAVYMAKDLKLNKMVAVKLLLPHLVANETNATRFHLEAQAASSLFHPNLISMHDYGVAEGQPYIVMELVDGTSLSDLLKEEGRFSVERAVPIFIQIADALDHAHGKGILHRDLKPSNVMITTSDNDFDFVRLVDFGIAKVVTAEGAESMGLTRTGEIFGSPAYMSPEQCTSQRVDARSDIYAMGCLMYEVIAGRTPFFSDNMMDLLYKQLNDPPPSFRELDQELSIPQELQLIIFKCLAKKTSDRYQSVEKLRQALNQFHLRSTAIFLKQVQAKWQVFKLKARPLKTREKRFLFVAVAALAIMSAGLLKIVSIYWQDSQELKIPTAQAFMRIHTAPKIVSTSELMAARAMEKSIREQLGTASGPSDLIPLISRTEAMAKTYFSKGQYDLSEKYYRILIALNREVEGGDKTTYNLVFAKKHLGLCLFLQGKYKQSIPLFEEFNKSIEHIGSGPRDIAYRIEALQYLALARYSMGDYIKARQAYEKVLRLRSLSDLPAHRETDALLYARLADCYRLEKIYKDAASNYEEARDEYKRRTTIGIDKVDKVRLTLCEFFLGYCYYQSGEYEKADIQYRVSLPRLKRLSGDYQEIIIPAMLQYADTLWRRGNYWKSFVTGIRARELKAILYD